MSLPEPKAGLVIRYSYLWHDEHEKGREEGLKDRPCAVILSSKQALDKWVVTVVPITHRQPTTDIDAVEIPLITKKRLGLDTDQSWALISEVNRFVWPGPDLRPADLGKPGKYDFGYLPPRLFTEIKNALLERAQKRKLKTVMRTH